MKTRIIILMLLLTVISNGSNAKDKGASEKYGSTLNLGIGIGYYGYIGHSVPVGTLNYEFDVARNFTLAPFAGIYSYQNYYYWGYQTGNPYFRQYSYRETDVPVGIKGAYYFDELFQANPKWDFYAAGSVGFVFRSVVWENGYYGDKHVYQRTSVLFLDVHIGTEYHLNQKLGLFFDLSSGVSTFGLALHY